MALFRKAFDQVGDPELDAPMARDVVDESSQLRVRRESPEKQEIAGLQERRTSAQVFDTDPAILQQSPLSIHVTDG
jgi:hypothetical protein